MKTRDYDVIRDILIVVVNSENDVELNQETIPAHEFSIVKYNYKLLKNRNYLTTVSNKDNSAEFITGLTWEGHDLYEMVKPVKATRKILNGLSEKMVGVSFDVFKTAYNEAAKSVVKEMIDEDFVKDIIN